MKFFVIFLIVIGSLNAFSQEKTMGKVIHSKALEGSYLNLCKSNNNICQLSSVESYQVGTPCLCSDSSNEHYVDVHFIDENDTSNEESESAQ